jgi:hypothetical protein
VFATMWTSMWETRLCKVCGSATVDAPDTFNGTLTMKQRWFKAEGPMRETICAENNKDYFNQGLFAVPEAERPDF